MSKYPMSRFLRPPPAINGNLMADPRTHLPTLRIPRGWVIQRRRLRCSRSFMVSIGMWMGIFIDDSSRLSGKRLDTGGSVRLGIAWICPVRVWMIRRGFLQMLFQGPTTTQSSWAVATLDPLITCLGWFESLTEKYWLVLMSSPDLYSAIHGSNHNLLDTSLLHCFRRYVTWAFPTNGWMYDHLWLVSFFLLFYTSYHFISIWPFRVGRSIYRGRHCERESGFRSSRPFVLYLVDIILILGATGVQALVYILYLGGICWSFSSIWCFLLCWDVVHYSCYWMYFCPFALVLVSMMMSMRTWDAWDMMSMSMDLDAVRDNAKASCRWFWQTVVIVELGWIEFSPYQCLCFVLRVPLWWCWQYHLSYCLPILFFLFSIIILSLFSCLSFSFISILSTP